MPTVLLFGRVRAAVARGVVSSVCQFNTAAGESPAHTANAKGGAS